MRKITIAYGYCFSDSPNHIYHDLDGNEINGWDLVHIRLPKALEKTKSICKGSTVKLLDYGAHFEMNSTGKCLSFKVFQESLSEHFLELNLKSVEEKRQWDLIPYNMVLRSLHLDIVQHSPKVVILSNC